MPAILDQYRIIAVYDANTLSYVDWDGTVQGVGAEVRPATATVANVAASASNQTALASNSIRRFMTFYNDADKACYIKFGTTASTSSFTVKLATDGFFSAPYPVYTGQVDVIWDTAPTGSLRVTEGTQA